MNFRVQDVLLRQPEKSDAEALYRFKNDPEVAMLLGGFSRGYTLQDTGDWVERHRNRDDEVIWVIADTGDDSCLGHVGLYQLDHRIRSAEFAIMLGDKSRWGQGLGRALTTFVIGYAFEMLNLNRVALTVLANNSRARHLYESLGFQQEGLLRQAQFKEGAYLDVVVMALLRGDYPGGWFAPTDATSAP